MWNVDGSKGEGGGQILRSALSLSVLTGTALRMANIRAGRARPGLMRQHLAAVRAAATISGGTVEGDAVGSTGIELRPGPVRAGDHTFDTGGAGSTTLVFQTVLWPLLLGARGESVLTFVGGTHNPLAPPVDFLVQALLPILGRFGARVDLTFDRHGFYPAGGGSWSVRLQGGTALGALELLERGAILERAATAITAQVPPEVGWRELDTLQRELDWPSTACTPHTISRAHGPGNVLLATVRSEHVTEVFTGFGERGVRAEAVAKGVASEVTRYLQAGVPVGEHLADQLLLPMALGAGGAFRTVTPSLHTRTQIELLDALIGARFTTTEEASDVWRIECAARSPSSKPKNLD